MPLDFWDKVSRCPIPSKEDFEQRKGVAWVSSNCVPARVAIMRKLMELIPIHSLGACLKNGKRPDKKKGQLETLYQKFKVVIGFDKIDDQDYVSEKFYLPIYANSLLVYFGTRSSSLLFPFPHSFVQASNFPDLHSLADHISTLVSNYEEWKSYFSWRNGPISQETEWKMKALQSFSFANPSATCRICDCLCEPSCRVDPSPGIGIGGMFANTKTFIKEKKRKEGSHCFTFSFLFFSFSSLYLTALNY